MFESWQTASTSILGKLTNNFLIETKCNLFRVQANSYIYAMYAKETFICIPR